MKELHKTIKLIRSSVNKKQKSQARHWLRQARRLLAVLPREDTVQEREQVNALYRRLGPPGQPGTTAKPAKAKPKVPAKAAKPAARPKATTTKPPQPPAVRELGNRFINRTALGYGAPGVRDVPPI